MTLVDSIAKALADLSEHQLWPWGAMKWWSVIDNRDWKSTCSILFCLYDLVRKSPPVFKNIYTQFTILLDSRFNLIYLEGVALTMSHYSHSPLGWAPPPATEVTQRRLGEGWRASDIRGVGPVTTVEELQKKQPETNYSKPKDNIWASIKSVCGPGRGMDKTENWCFLSCNCLRTK